MDNRLKVDSASGSSSQSLLQMKPLSDNDSQSSKSDSDNRPAVPLKLTTAARRDVGHSDKMEALTFPFNKESVMWCEKNNILAYSARAVPYFDEEKNRISKGKMSYEDGIATGFTTKTNKGITTWDASKLCKPKRDEFGTWTLMMMKTGEASRIVVIDVDIHGNQTPQEVIGESLFNRLWESCSYIVKTGSGGYHFYYRLPEGKSWTKMMNLATFAGQDTKGQLDILANGHSVILAGSFYEYQNQKYRYKVDVEDDEGRVMTMDDISDMPDWVIDAIDAADEERHGSSKHKVEEPMDTPDTPKNTIVAPVRSKSPNVRTSLEELRLAADLINCLSRDFFVPYDNWVRFIICLKSISKTEAMKQLCVEACAKSPKHRSSEHTNATAQKWDEIEPNGAMTMGTLRYWARQQNEKMYLEVMKASYSQLLLGSINDIASVFASETAGSLVYDDLSNPKLPKFFRYDEALRLWTEIDESQLEYFFVEMMPSVIDRVRQDLRKSSKGEDDEKKLKQLVALYCSINTGKGSKYLKPLRTILNPRLMPNNYKDQKFALNERPELLPLANGVFNFKTGQLEAYDRSHYLSYKLDIAYNPAADTSLIQKAMEAWYKKDTEKISFIQYWLGYSITGFTERDEFLIVYGKNGGNGKTILYEEILGEDIFGDHLYQSLSEDALVKKGGHNDSLYDAEGKRLLLMSEVGKARGQHRLNVEILKKWTGRGKISANAKFEREKRFIPVGKIVMLTNQLPELPADDGGIARRLLCLEQNVMFVKPELYADYDEEMKRSGDVMPQDDKFISALRANKEGWIKWLVEGAMMYMKDPKRRAPQSILKYTEECRAAADKYMSWITSHLIITGNQKDVLASADITAYYNQSNGLTAGNAVAKKELISRFNSLPKITQEGDQSKGRLKFKGVVWNIGCCPNQSEEQRVDEEEAFNEWKSKNKDKTALDYLRTEEGKEARRLNGE